MKRMPIRKVLFILCLPFCFLGACFFYHPFAQRVLDVALHLAVQWSTDYKITYHSVDWKEGKILIIDPILLDAKGTHSSFYMHAKQIEITPKGGLFSLRGHIEIEQPQCYFDHFKPFPALQTQWTFAISKGQVQWRGIEPAEFSLGQSSSQGWNRLCLNWGEAQLTLEILQEEEERKLCVEFQQMRAPLLQKLARFYQIEPLREGCVISGALQGKMYLQGKETLFESGSCHLQAQDLGVQFSLWEIHQCSAQLDWEGEFSGDLASRLGQLRLSLYDLDLCFPFDVRLRAAVDLAFYRGLGLKWETEGNAQTALGNFPIRGDGRMYFHDLTDHWALASLELGESTLDLHMEGGKEEIWSCKIQKLLAKQGAFFQGIIGVALPELFDWDLRQGEIDARVELCVDQAKVQNWQVQGIRAKNLSLAWNRVQMDVGDVEGWFSSGGGDLSFQEGRFVHTGVGQTGICADGWAGRAYWQGKRLYPSCFTGCVEGAQVALQLLGAWDGWQATVSSGGSIQGQGAFEGYWANDRMVCQIPQAQVQGIDLSGDVWVGSNGFFSLSLDQFEGPLEGIAHLSPFASLSGRIHSFQKGLQVEGTLEEWDGSLEASLEEVTGEMHSLSIQNAQGKIFVSRLEQVLYSWEGEWVVPRGILHFACPEVYKTASSTRLDVRLKTPVWDWFRLCGVYEAGTFQVDSQKSQLLGAPLQVSQCVWDLQQGLEVMEGKWCIESQTFQAALPFFHSLHLPLPDKLPLRGDLAIEWHLDQKGTSEISMTSPSLHWEEIPLPLQVHAFKQKESWEIDQFRCAALQLHGFLQTEEIGWTLCQGKVNYQEKIFADLSGTMQALSDWTIAVDSLQMHLDTSTLWQSVAIAGIENWEGILEGKGFIACKEELQAQLSLAPAQLRRGAFILQNRSPIEMIFSRKEGIECRGVDFHVSKEGEDSPGIAMQVQKILYDPSSSHCLFLKSHVVSPPHLRSFLGDACPVIFRSFDASEPIAFKADFDWTISDFSLKGWMEEAFVPLREEMLSFREVGFSWGGQRCEISFGFFHQKQWLHAELRADLQEAIVGKLTLQDGSCRPEEIPLSIQWEYHGQEGLLVRAIEGIFGGVEASFHAEVDSLEPTLIGSARVDFSKLSALLPQELTEVFSNLEMGKGYELKGRWVHKPQGWGFQGLLSGKQLELFGYQFRTLLAQLDFSLDHVHLSDLKISDSAGILKVDQILLQGRGEDFWTWKLPHLLISEFRPSLLQKPGEPLGEMTPLLVRSLEIRNLEGLVEDASTWRAEGELEFINSYKREHTVLDFPADLLGRIVGLDTELFIPVRGHLTYELREGRFYLHQLLGAFSENNRTEFFLVHEGRPPFMDLDGNLSILIKMKQFVLFKLTEAFMISVEGTLKDPEFHLVKRKPFWAF